MPMIDAQPSAARDRPGALQRAFRRVTMRRATVTACEAVGRRFRLITLEGPQLRGVRWTAGQKVQIAMGASFATRTYTPIEWDDAAGRTRILGYAHGDGPGAAWVRSAIAGDRHDVFGPRGSLDASGVQTPLVVFGDETSMGLAFALQSERKGRAVSCRFEVAQADDAERALDRLGFDDARLFGDAQEGRRLKEMEAELPIFAAAGATFVLTGRALAIQHLRQALRRLEVPGVRVMTKAYWALGKRGLD